MAEYIEREALMKYPIRIDHYDKEHGNEHFVLGIESVLEYAENLPTADVAPVRHERWDDSHDGITPYCSACGHSHRLTVRPPNYCPNCGALMQKGD